MNVLTGSPRCCRAAKPSCSWSARRRSSLGRASIAVLSLETGEYRVVWPEARTRITVDRPLVYARAGKILAAPFDVAGLRVTGPRSRLFRASRPPQSVGMRNSACSQNGSLVYAPGRAWGADRRLLWVDRSGRTEPILGDLGAWEEPRSRLMGVASRSTPTPRSVTSGLPI